MRTRSVGLGPCVYGNLVYGTAVAVYYLTTDDAAGGGAGGDF